VSPLIIVVGVGLPKFELVFDDIANQCVSLAYIISFSAGVDRKGIGKARNNGRAYNGQCFIRRPSGILAFP